MDPNNTKKGKRGGKRRIPLSPFAMKVIRRLRSLPKWQAAFSLSITSEETPHTMEVIRNGGPASTYYIHVGQRVPDRLPPDSTYVVGTPTELDTVLAYFANDPSMWGAPAGEPLEGDWESYSDSYAGYPGAGGPEG